MPISDSEVPLIKVTFCRLFKMLVLSPLNQFFFVRNKATKHSNTHRLSKGPMSVA